MATEAQKLAAFRKRLAIQRAAWLIDIDISRKRSVTLELTAEQQALLRRATRRVFPSATLIFESNVITSPVHTALCNLETGRPAARAKSRAKKPAAGRGGRKPARATR
jgi:hypothetical protein